MNYSIFIKSLKYIFVVISFIFIILVIYNNSTLKTEISTNNTIIEERDFSSVTQVLHGPMFVGVDKKQPFKVMAKKATRYKKSPDIFNLENPTGEIKSEKKNFFLVEILVYLIKKYNYLKLKEMLF